MNSTCLPQSLLKHPNLWRAGELAAQQAQERRGIASGFPQLDQHLPDQGWPAGGLVEFMLSCTGIGELRLLMPALKSLSHDEVRWLAWINPPFIPYAPALQEMGVDIGKVLLIHPRTHKEALWALERACRSGTCSAALAWLDDKRLKSKDTQRLQAAAKQGRTLTCLFRPRSARLQPSMAELRLTLTAAGCGSTAVDIIKRRGGWSTTDLILPVAETTGTTHRQRRDIREQLELWRQHRTQRNNTPSQTVENRKLRVPQSDTSAAVFVTSPTNPVH